MPDLTAQIVVVLLIVLSVSMTCLSIRLGIDIRQMKIDQARDASFDIARWRLVRAHVVRMKLTASWLRDSVAKDELQMTGQLIDSIAEQANLLDSLAIGPNPTSAAPPAEREGEN